jgi:hypothetical protein
VGWWSGRIALTVAPENGVAGAQHYMVRARTAHDRLMEIVAHGILIGEALQEWNVAFLNVVKRHRVATAVVVNSAEKGSNWFV